MGRSARVLLCRGPPQPPARFAVHPPPIARLAHARKALEATLCCAEQFVLFLSLARAQGSSLVALGCQLSCASRPFRTPPEHDGYRVSHRPSRGPPGPPGRGIQGLQSPARRSACTWQCAAHSCLGGAGPSTLGGCVHGKRARVAERDWCAHGCRCGPDGIQGTGCGEWSSVAGDTTAIICVTDARRHVGSSPVSLTAGTGYSSSFASSLPV